MAIKIDDKISPTGYSDADWTAKWHGSTVIKFDEDGDMHFRSPDGILGLELRELVDRWTVDEEETIDNTPTPVMVKHIPEGDYGIITINDFTVDDCSFTISNDYYSLKAIKEAIKVLETIAETIEYNEKILE